MIDTVFEIDVERNPLTARSFAKARAESRAEGEYEGKLEERRRTVARMLEVSRGLSADEEQLLANMDEVGLDAVLDAAMTFLRDRTDEALSALDAALDSPSHPKP